MALTIVRLAPTDVARVAHLQRPPAARGGGGPISAMTAADDPLQHAYALEHEGEVVGAFRIDRDFARIDARLPVGTHGLRGLLIGGQYQRLGLGERLLSMLPRALQTIYPEVEYVYLRVDADNSPAIRAYQAHGWTLAGRPDAADRSGRQTLMKLELRG